MEDKVKQLGLEIETFTAGPLMNNIYLLWDPISRAAVLVDPSMESEFISAEIVGRDLDLRFIINTHCHFDHSCGNAFFKRTFNCPLLIHQGDLPLLRGLADYAKILGFSVDPSPEPDGFLAEGKPVRLGSNELGVLHTPGHSPGSVCLHSGGFILSGDTLFAQSIGRTDLPGSSFEAILDSITTKLFTFPDQTGVLSGHGPPTSIGFEKKHNPFLSGWGAR